MVPIQICIEGFLSFRGRQVIDLTGMDLCMLSGPNGSGKSSVFDALTVALFNTHRAGTKGREDLINKKSDNATLELDFELNGQRWQARRTLSRKKSGTQVIRRWSEDKQDWETMPDTSSARGFETWVMDHVGLSAETFTTSMLLRQGKADRLLTAAPKERHELLSAVVGMEQYIDLHARATDQRKTRKTRLDDLESQLNNLPKVTDEQLTAATALVESSATALQAAEANVEQLQPLVDHAKRFVGYQKDLQAAEASLKQFEGLLAQADKLEKDCARLKDLDGVLPKFRSLRETCDRRRISVGKAEKLAASEKTSLEEQKVMAGQIEALNQSLTATVSEIEQHVTGERTTSTRLAELNVILTQADTLAAQQKELDERRVELQNFPKHPDLELEQTKVELQRIADVKEALLPLTQLADERRKLIDAQQPLKDQQAAVKTAGIDATKVIADLVTAKREYDAAEASQRNAQEQDAQAMSDLKQAKASTKAIAEADDNVECPTCGHELTKDHLTQEKSRRQAAEKFAAQARAEAAKALLAANVGLERVRRRHAELETRRGQLENAIESGMRETRGIGDDIAKAVKACAAAYRSLSQAYRDRVGTIAEGSEKVAATWIATTYPTSADLDGVTADIAKLSAAKKRVTELESVHTKWNKVTTELTMLEKSVADATARGGVSDIAPLRDEHTKLTAEQKSLERELKSRRTQHETLRKQSETLQAKATELASSIAVVRSDIAAEKARVEGFDQAIVTCRAELTGDWAKTDVDKSIIERLDAEQKQLRFVGIELAEKQLQDAKQKSKTATDKIAMLTGYIADIPAAARQETAAMQAQLDAARTERLGCQKASQDAQAEQRKLEADRKARADRDTEYKRIDREHRLYQTLTNLLGRDGLQLHLMRQAEKAIVKFANDILAPISGGDLMLRLRFGDDGDSESALDLEAFHTRISEGDAIAVPFLSGSQQFRVAVALALAIGQYAGGGNRLGECVIIDEGFGSLDTQGQEVMIEELQRLKGIMKRIILVSHQESFAAVFNSGYRFRLEDGETRVSRTLA